MKTNLRQNRALFLGLVCSSLILPFGLCGVAAAAVTNSPAPKTLNTPRDFPPISSSKEWRQRAQQIREQILVSCGLWPMPERTPLNAHCFGKIERDGYSIEKVYLETYPGFYLAGNLYRPLGRGKGPFPAILNPHGHWSNGRMADNKDGSIAGRCISFARQGMMAFSYDMVGYNDTHFADSPTNRSFSDIHHLFATERANQLWSISLMGLQTWNSVRALDFLEHLPGVDRKRLACTGESGGGTQTFMLGAIEDRLAAQAPIVMVSHTMQGGCLCENAPGLRVEYSNMEIAAAPAPRPQILVAATGDWTKDTLTFEGPAIAGIYELCGARSKFHFVRFNFDHNYNQTSREAVYEWFGRWLLKHRHPETLREAPFQKEPDAELRVFPDGRMPAGALTQAQFIESLKQLHRRNLESLLPRDKAGLKHFQQVMLPAWRHSLQVDWPRGRAHVQSDEPRAVGEFTRATLRINRLDEDASIEATYWAPAKILADRAPKLVVLCSPEGLPAPTDGATAPDEQSLDFLKEGLAVLAVNRYASPAPKDQFADFFSTYNRTKLQQRVRDLITVCSIARSADPRKPLLFRVILCGTGHAGFWVCLAGPAADAVIADCDQLDTASETTMLGDDLFFPGSMNLGGFQGAALLAAPHPVLLHNTGGKFPPSALHAAYDAHRVGKSLRLQAEPVSGTQAAAWAAHAE